MQVSIASKKDLEFIKFPFQKVIEISVSLIFAFEKNQKNTILI